jgi:predicted DNA-binding helix-hairpin-helix protein
MREHRLYQADWLLRVYDFSLQEVELALEKDGDFALNKDPKLVIARRQPWLFPVDVNTASYSELLRVPGIGPTSAQRIVEARKGNSITSLDQLKKMRVVTKRAAPFVWYKSMLNSEKQLSFMPELEDEVVLEPSLVGALG